MAGATIVKVLAKRIRKGIAGDCHGCPVAKAILETLSERHCEPQLVDIEWVTYVVVWGRYLPAPAAVREFMWAFDSLPRTKAGRAKLPKKLAGDLAPFSFTLPPFESGDWLDSCSRCGRVFEESELNGDGACHDCLHSDED
jgi:hypothetical protein